MCSLQTVGTLVHLLCLRMFFYLWLWIKLEALKRLKDDQLTSETEPYELWKQLWCFSFLWISLIKTFYCATKKERRSWYQADLLALLDLVYLKSGSNTCLLISLLAGMSALRFLAHKGSHRWQIRTWLTHSNSVLVGGCFNQMFWRHSVWQVIATEAFKRCGSNCCWQVDLPTWHETWTSYRPSFR